MGFGYAGPRESCESGCYVCWRQCGKGVKKGEGMKDVPCWAVHEELDRVIPFAASVGMVDALRSVGKQVRFEVQEGVGHSCWTKEY